jgi:hypothetical protein
VSFFVEIAKKADSPTVIFRGKNYSPERTVSPLQELCSVVVAVDQ